MERQDVLAEYVGALGVFQFHIEHIIVDKHVTGKLVDVYLVGIGIGAGQDEAGQFVEVVLDEVEARFVVVLGEIGLLDVDGQGVGCVAELVNLVVVAVQLQQHGVGVVVKVDAVVRQPDVLGEVVAAPVFAVEIEFYGNDVIGGHGAGHLCHLHGHGIGHHGTGLVVGQKHPALAGGEAEGFFLGIELQAVGTFSPSALPAGVATAFDIDRVGEIGEDTRAVNQDFGTQIDLLAGDHLPAFHVDVNARHLGGMVGEPVNLCPHGASVGMPVESVDRRVYQHAVGTLG